MGQAALGAAGSDSRPLACRRELCANVICHAGTVAFWGNGGGILSELSKLETRSCERRFGRQMPLCSISQKKSHGCDEMKCRTVFDLKLRFRFWWQQSKAVRVKYKKRTVGSLGHKEGHMKMVIMFFTLALCRTFPGSLLRV